MELLDSGKLLQIYTDTVNCLEKFFPEDMPRIIVSDADLELNMEANKAIVGMLRSGQVMTTIQMSAWQLHHKICNYKQVELEFIENHYAILDLEDSIKLMGLEISTLDGSADSKKEKKIEGIKNNRFMESLKLRSLKRKQKIICDANMSQKVIHLTNEYFELIDAGKVDLKIMDVDQRSKLLLSNVFKNSNPNNDAPKQYNKDEELAKLFEPVGKAQLEAIFPDKNWDSWINHASSNKLASARIKHGRYNPYLVSLWLVNEQTWTTRIALSKLKSHVPVASKDKWNELVNEDFL